MTALFRVLKLACSLLAFPIVTCQKKHYRAEFGFKFFGKLSDNSYQTIFSAVGETFGESLTLCTKFCIHDQRCIGIETCQIRKDQFQCRVCCGWKKMGNNAEERPGCKYLEMVIILLSFFI
jgi:hypothetical protein